MIYILGTTSREYQIEGICLPKKTYTDREIELGKRTCISISDVEYAKLGSNKIFASLVKQGVILVRDSMPEDAETLPELRQRLQGESESANKKIAELEDIIAELQSGNIPEGYISPAEAEVLKENIRTLGEELAALKEEALKEIAARDAEIIELKALLEEAK